MPLYVQGYNESLNMNNTFSTLFVLNSPSRKHYFLLKRTGKLFPYSFCFKLIASLDKSNRHEGEEWKNGEQLTFADICQGMCGNEEKSCVCSGT